jgi:hypothetical protein
MSCLINGLSSINSHFALGTSHLTAFSAGGEDYTIFYQSLFLYACWYMYTVYGHAALTREITYARVLICDGCTHRVPEAQISIGYQHISVTSDIREPEQHTGEEIHLGVLIGKRLAASAFTYENDCFVDDYIPLLTWGGAVSNVVTIPLFRKADPRAVIWALCLRYNYLIQWAAFT